MRTRNIVALALLASTTTALMVIAVTHGLHRYGGKESDPKPETRRIPLDRQYVTAVHEACHAVAHQALLPEYPFREMYIYADSLPDDDFLGMMIPDSLSEKDRGVPEKVEADAVEYYAGEIGEQVIFGTELPEDWFDKDQADGMLLALCQKPGVCGECPPASKVGEACMVNGLVTQKRAVQFVRAKDLIATNKSTVVELANLIMEQPIKNRRRTLTGAQIDAFMKAHPVTAPAPAPVSAEPPPMTPLRQVSP